MLWGIIICKKCFNASVNTRSTKALRKGQIATIEIAALHAKTIIGDIFCSTYRPQVAGEGLISYNKLLPSTNLTV